MSSGSVFLNNKTQAVRLPKDSKFPDGIKKVNVRKLGVDRILSPIDKIWDSFFLSDDNVSDDFMSEREVDKSDKQKHEERESF